MKEGEIMTATYKVFKFADGTYLSKYSDSVTGGVTIGFTANLELAEHLPADTTIAGYGLGLLNGKLVDITLKEVE